MLLYISNLTQPISKHVSFSDFLENFCEFLNLITPAVQSIHDFLPKHFLKVTLEVLLREKICFSKTIHYYVYNTL